MNPSPPALACDLSTLTDDQRIRLIAVSAEVFGAASEVRELPNGFALAYRHASPELIAKVAEFIAYDRLCCAFLEHAMVSEPAGGPMWLKISGGRGAKEVIADDVRRLTRRTATVIAN
ncbi:MAG TPA: hypothetical protein VF383_14090 [Candidatus Dormibacteraeota bacterium]